MEPQETSVPHQHTYFDAPFPRVITPGEGSEDLSFPDVQRWVRENLADLEEKLHQSGVLLFRGFPLSTDLDFDGFIEAFGYENFPYKESLSNAVRRNRTDRVFTANEAPPEVTIFLHHEMAQTPMHPSKLFFFCETPAENGGATPICRSDALFAELKKQCPEFATNCETKGLLYSNVMPPEDDPESGMGRSWGSTLRAETKEDAEARLTQLGYSYEWLEGDCLRATTPVLPATYDLGEGRHSFFNQLIAAFQGWKDSRNKPEDAIRFGDGSPLDRASVDRATELAEEFTFDVPWEQGDVALVDNRVAMHGRRHFSGTRKVLASLVV
ncbi:MAG: TauD/TfdA family dioxygenase [Verrucomicrobiota bacterium]